MGEAGGGLFYPDSEEETWWCDCRDRKGADSRHGMILTALVDIETGQEIPGSRK